MISVTQASHLGMTQQTLTRRYAKDEDEDEDNRRKAVMILHRCDEATTLQARRKVTISAIRLYPDHQEVASSWKVGFVSIVHISCISLSSESSQPDGASEVPVKFIDGSACEDLRATLKELFLTSTPQQPLFKV